MLVIMLRQSVAAAVIAVLATMAAIEAAAPKPVLTPQQVRARPHRFLRSQLAAMSSALSAIRSLICAPEKFRHRGDAHPAHAASQLP